MYTGVPGQTISILVTMAYPVKRIAWPWAGLACLLVFIPCALLTSSSVQGEMITLTRLDVGGDIHNQKGWMRATITFNNKTSVIGSVCGQPDPASFYLACWTTGWLAVISQGTVGTVGFDVGEPDYPVISNLTCSGKSRLPCTFDMKGLGSCVQNRKNIAALSCCELNTTTTTTTT
uniref:Uncharacterized protein 25 n=1 Tax=Halisarca dujardinii TaxID=2583056 RepID=A0AA96MLV6_HALDU|nr:uncharacterized protein 25 [Halisarca dujardinii]